MIHARLSLSLTLSLYASVRVCESSGNLLLNLYPSRISIPDAPLALALALGPFGRSDAKLFWRFFENFM